MAKESEIIISRRVFFKAAVIGTAVGVGAALIPETAIAEETPKTPPCAPGTSELDAPLAIGGVSAFLANMGLLLTLCDWDRGSESLGETAARYGGVLAGDAIFFGIGYGIGKRVEFAAGRRIAWCTQPKKK